MPGAVVELWQANAAGRYFHPIDTRDAPLDPELHRQRPGAERCRRALRLLHHPARRLSGPGPETWWRPPHVHFSVLGPASLSRLVTQMYFPGDPLNPLDRILMSVPDAAARERLVARQVPPGRGRAGLARLCASTSCCAAAPRPRRCHETGCRAPSPSTPSGPSSRAAFVRPGDNDLTRHRRRRRAPSTRGERILLRGRVTREGGCRLRERAGRGLAGRCRRPLPPPGGPGAWRWRIRISSAGAGRSTDADGAFEFRTLLPGGYAEGNHHRAPHVQPDRHGLRADAAAGDHLFFPDFPAENAADPVLGLVPPAARARLAGRSRSGDGGAARASASTSGCAAARRRRRPSSRLSAAGGAGGGAGGPGLHRPFRTPAARPAPRGRCGLGDRAPRPGPRKGRASMDLGIRSLRSAGQRGGRKAVTAPAGLRPPKTPGSAVGRLR